mmetsp:Transcript_21597/g.57095  ORF Transcript_21597/g.57095 Transcript_21597/m.57095 type:complete len:467 (-) Transcript_21597:77-1477(-)
MPTGSLAMPRQLLTLFAVALVSLPDAAAGARLRHANATAQRATLEKSADYKVKLGNYRNVQYSGEFLAGGQVLPVIYDTGSFEVILLSTLCSQGCSQYMIMYDEVRSHSFTGSGDVYGEHHFGSGSVFSKKGYETLAIGGKDSPLVTRHMQFWQVVRNKIAVWNERAVFSGIVGLSHVDTIPRGFRVEGYPEETLLSAMHVKSFSICLERSGPSAPGWLAAGPSTDALRGGATFQSAPVEGKVHWAVRMTDLHLPGSGLPALCSGSCGAIIDSGTSLIAAPRSAARLVRDLKMMVRSDCSNLYDLPVLRLTLGGVLVELPPKAYVMKVAKSTNASDWYGETQYRCTAAFMTINKRSNLGPVWILGMPFLRYYYTVFDREAKRIHIAPSSPYCEAPGSFAIANSTVLANSTLHLVHAGANASNASRLGLGAQTRAFTSADYEPMPVDMNATRQPSWSLGDAEELLDV